MIKGIRMCCLVGTNADGEQHLGDSPLERALCTSNGTWQSVSQSLQRPRKLTRGGTAITRDVPIKPAFSRQQNVVPVLLNLHDIFVRGIFTTYDLEDDQADTRAGDLTVEPRKSL
jgi:hypothetical protein